MPSVGNLHILYMPQSLGSVSVIEIFQQPVIALLISTGESTQQNEKDQNETDSGGYSDDLLLPARGRHPIVVLDNLSA
jgi:hypothetical protein